MSVKEASESINSKGYSGISELKYGFVVLQPKGVKMSSVWVVKPSIKKHRGQINTKPAAVVEWESIENTNNRFLEKISKSLRLSNSHKLYPKNSFIKYIRASHIHINSSDDSELFDENFETKFYRIYKNRVIEVISNESGKVNINSDLIFRYVKLKSPFSKKEFSILFQPSRYLNSEENIWMLISIVGEDYFTKKIEENNNIINDKFILDTFRGSGQYYYISKQSKKVFSSLNQRYESKYPDISRLKLSTLLGFLKVKEIEELIEKGEKSY